MSIHIAKRKVQVKRFDHEGLHQLQKKTGYVVEMFYLNFPFSYVNAHQCLINLLDNVT